MVIFLEVKSLHELLIVDCNILQEQIFATLTAVPKQFFSPVADQAQAVRGMIKAARGLLYSIFKAGQLLRLRLS